MKNIVLENSIKLRHIEIVKSSSPPEVLKTAKIRLEDPKDYQSQLIFPAMILYPTTDEFDFIAEISELTTPLELLEMVLTDLGNGLMIQNTRISMSKIGMLYGN